MLLVCPVCTESRSLSGRLAATLAGMLAVTAGATLTGCAVSGDEAAPEDPNAGLLRDFLDGKFDAAGHPLNARVTDAEELCGSAGTLHDGVLRLSQACVGALPGSEQRGDLVASLRIRVHGATGNGTIVSGSLTGPDGEVLASRTLTADELRHADWIDFPLTWASRGMPVTVTLTPTPGAVVDLDYVEVFTERFGLVASPGSRVLLDSDLLVFELPKGRKLDRVELDGVDITERLDDLLFEGKAQRTMTELRTLVEVAVGDLATERLDVSELELRAGSLAARMQIRRAPTPCSYEGDPAGVKVLVTGFQPFPADGWHDNISEVAVTALDPSQLRGAQVMRVVMPVEYDLAAAQITDIIERCAPAAVISFGQGGGSIALEEVAYNLQDTGEVPGGVPDNRGIIRAAALIDPGAPATRDTLLPLDAIEQALVALGEHPHYSRDPGRYICNNVMFANIGATSARGGIGGFIHLPYTTRFDDGVRQRFGAIVREAVQVTADSLR